MIKNNPILEQLIVGRLKAADPDMFTEIFSVYYKDLVLFAYSFTHEKEDSEEIVQDVFVKLWEDHEKINISTSIKSYLLKSIQNKCIDWHRHKKVINHHSNYIIENSLLYEYDTDNYILSSEMELIIEKALASLPENVKETFEMSRFEGMKYQEIADKLNVSVRTIEVRISKALELLRESLIDFL
ncbi:MAG: RNA polymerase sigma-70 factor [Bacteroidales bacterium]|nr:RNA polymerase sigma-70 factor [Bacteroidales bacterium]MBK8882110.1 RNA polymerase sigma-70 factor [Bacteroidales bacterium]